MATMSRQPANQPPDHGNDQWQVENYAHGASESVFADAPDSRHPVSADTQPPYLNPSHPPSTGYTIPFSYTQVAPHGTALTHAQNPSSSSYVGALHGVNLWEAPAASNRDMVPASEYEEPTQIEEARSRLEGEITTVHRRRRVRQSPYDRPRPSR
jgi:redox-sensitive bicupin YhaK (pirin superfamily)